MAVGVALSELRRQLRAEVGQTLNTAQGVNAQGQYDLALARQQQELWEAYDWPHLEYSIDVPVQAGQQVYDYPADMPFDSINSIWSVTNGKYDRLNYGIRTSDLNSYTNRGWPAQQWANSVKMSGGKVVPAGQFRLVPVPSQNGMLRFVGQAPCNPLVADDDICVLDSTLITLFAAAEILAFQKAENASLKLQKAQQYLRRLLANQGGDKREITVLNGANIAAAMQPIGSTRRFRTPTD
jgi:hypothetical protein